MKKIAELSLQETPLVYPIIKDYLNQQDSLSNFVNVWQDINSFGKLIRQRNFEKDKRKVLVQHLLTQYKQAGIELSEDSITFKQINLLTQENSFTITTGHQLSLFGGTLFMTYKILTAIKLSQEVKIKHPESNFIPVLWLASEDHDFEEIKSTYLFGNNLVWEKDSQSRACGAIDLEGIELVLQEIKNISGTKPRAQEWVQKLEDAYHKNDTLGLASIRFYHSLFETFGLVVLDANSVELKQQFKGIIKEDLLEQKSYSHQVTTDESLEEKYKLQIHARPYNFFYLNNRFERKLIKQLDDKFLLDSHLVDRDALEIEIENHPERFSPNVNLRPVYQECILPNLAYIGGPAEVAYWLQLKSVFDGYGIPYPMVVLRFMNVLVGSGLKEKIEKSGLSITDVVLDEKLITEKLLKQGQPFDFAGKMENVLQELQELVDFSKGQDASIGKDFLDQKLLIKDFFKSRTAAIKKAITLKEEGTIEKVLKLRNKLYPQNVFQERIETLLQNEWLLDRSLCSEILEQMEVLTGKLMFCEN